MDTFALDVVIDPRVSIPGAAPYNARGIFTSRSVAVQLQDGGVYDEQETTFGFRLVEIKATLTTHDRVIAPDGTIYEVGDCALDGQGGLVVHVRRVLPEPFPPPTPPPPTPTPYGKVEP
jgi:hypothetical protein